MFVDINLRRLEDDDECIEHINEQKMQERHFSFLSKEPRYPPLHLLIDIVNEHSKCTSEEEKIRSYPSDQIA